ncbi:hypothetical protein F4802DRAFT_231031 [Xylaria palmicola]|nr:hypothetical protein F4802DRAFT_231031 [Xylaria palmicola]
MLECHTHTHTNLDTERDREQNTKGKTEREKGQGGIVPRYGKSQILADGIPGTRHRWFGALRRAKASGPDGTSSSRASPGLVSWDAPLPRRLRHAYLTVFAQLCMWAFCPLAWAEEAQISHHHDQILHTHIHTYVHTCHAIAARISLPDICLHGIPGRTYVHVGMAWHGMYAGAVRTHAARFPRAQEKANGPGAARERCRTSRSRSRAGQGRAGQDRAGQSAQARPLPSKKKKQSFLSRQPLHCCAAPHPAGGMRISPPSASGSAWQMRSYY